MMTRNNSAKSTGVIGIFELVLLLVAVLLGIWLFILPTLDTFGQLTLFSDDAIYAILAQRVLDNDFSAAFHLTWAPIFPWLLVVLNKYLNIPLSDGGRLITAAALVARIVPTWFLSREMFGKKSAFFTLLIIVPSSFFLTGGLTAQPETLYSLFVICTLTFGWLGISRLKTYWFVLAGIFSALAFMTRNEGWLMLIPLVAAILPIIILSKEKVSLFLKTVFVMLAAFLIVSFPYLRFVSQVYGSVAISPKAGITFTQPGNPFGRYDDKKGTTTLAQVFFSPDEPKYESRLWHPDVEIIRKHTQYIRDGIPVRLSNYPLLLESGLRSPLLYYLFLAGLFIPFAEKSRRSLFVKCLLLVVVLICSVDLAIYLLEFPFGNAKIWFDNRFLKYPRIEMLTESLIIIFGVRYLLSKRKIFLNDIYRNLKYIYFWAFSIVGMMILIVPNIFAFYLQWLVPVIAIVAGLAIGWIFNKVKSQKFLILAFTILLTVFLYLPVYSQAFRIRDINLTNERAENMYKLPGQAIFDNYGGPGAKVAVFHEGSVYYAKGRTFYFMTDGNTTLVETLKYLEDNNVDYMTVAYDEAWGNVPLRPLLNTETKLDNWKVIYAYKKDPAEPVVVWRATR